MITCLGLSPSLDITYGVPTLHEGGIHRPEWKLALPGGKSLNVARALHRLGGSVRAIAPLGGPIGDGIRVTLDEQGVLVEPVPTGEPTRLCVSVVDAGTERITEFYENAPPLDDEVWAGVTAALGRVHTGWLAVSGSVPPARARSLADALADAADRGVRLALDLRGEALEQALSRTRPHLVKVNRSEAEEALGAGGLEQLAAGLRGRGAEVAVVTDGAAGSLAADADGAWRAGSPPAGPYTVGAGDSFLAGLLHAFERHTPLPEALRSAAAIAAANTLVPGAAVFDTDAAEALAAGIEVRYLAGAEARGAS